MLKLPKLVLFEDYHGNWEEYVEALYSYFKQDFVDKKIYYRRIKLCLKKYPLFKNKEATFWHLISEGETEDERLPDMRRCERIRWSKPIIENSGDGDIKVWENIRGNQSNICLCYGNWDYLVVLRKRKRYLLFWTAYPVFENHRKRKLKREFAMSQQKANTAS